MVEAKLRRVGSSLGVILPKKVLDAAGLREGDLIDLPRIAPRVERDLYGAWRKNPVELGGEG